VESKKPRKPHKVAEARNLAALELIHTDLSEMNGVLTKGGKRYFMTLNDDCTRFCYVYLLNQKMKRSIILKSIKLKYKTNLREELNGYGLIVVENIFLVSFLSSVRNMGLFMRGHLHTHLNPMGLPKERTVL
jgi:hypothetical protein